MDLSLGILGILGLVGYNFRSKRLQEKPKRHAISPHSSPNGISVYESKDYLKVKNTEKKTLDKFHENVITVRGTNRVGTSYNKPTEKRPEIQTTERFGKNSNDLELIPEHPTQIYSGPMFNIGMKHDEEPAESNVKESFTDSRNFSKLAGTNINMEHKNMTPFFGSHPNTIMTNNNQTILSKHNGEARPAKKETFQIINGPVNNVNGLPLSLPELSRYIPSNKLQNVLPIEQIKVKPIPQEFTRILPKTLEELRKGALKQKLTYAGRVVDGIKGVKRGVMGEVKKNRPDRAFKQKFKFTNKAAGPEESPLVDYKTAHRDTSNKELLEDSFNLGIVQKGSSGQINRLSTKDDGKSTIYQGDSKNTFDNDWVRNRADGIRRDDKIQYTYRASEQERETTSRQEFIGVKGNNATYRNLDDVARTTNKQNVLYEYSGNVENANTFVPMNRKQYTNAEFKTRPTKEYTPGGLNSTGVDKNFVNIKEKDIPTLTDYFSVGSNRIPSTFNKKTIGDISYTYNSTEHDFGDRMITELPEMNYTRIQQR